MSLFLKRILFFSMGVLVGVGLAFGRAHWSRFVESFTEGQNQSALAFAVAGQVTYIAPLGTHVAAGDVVARLNDETLQVLLKKQQTTLALQKEALGVAQKNQQQVQAQATARLAKDTKTLITALATIASSTRLAVAQTDPLFARATSTAPVLLLPVDTLSAAAAQSGRSAVSNNIADLVTIGARATLPTTSLSALSSLADDATADVAEVQLFLESLDILNNQATSSSTTTLAWRKDIQNARAAIAPVIHTLLTAQNALENDQLVPNSPSLASAEKNIAQTQAAVGSTTAALTETVIYAPVAGKVTTPVVPVKIGQQVIAGQPVISLVTP